MLDLISLIGVHCDLCSAGHLQWQASSVKAAQPSDRLPGPPDISMLSPELQQQWHAKRNMHLGAIKVKLHSNIKAVWQCGECPAGQPHIWTARVTDRTRKGSQCPYCSNRLVCWHNSLAAIAPDAAQYWNHSKNEKTPEQVLAGSQFRAEWKCPTCNWEWQAAIFGRTRRKAGCPKCSKRMQNWQSQPTFAEARPACLAEWDYERNDAENIYPDSTTLGSGKQVHWICSCCPHGQPHRWTATPNMRISNGSGCAVCAGKQACVCNSLASLYPLLAAEFDVDKNSFEPSEIPARSNKKVWWRNAKRGSWRQSPNARTDRRNELYALQVWLRRPPIASIASSTVDQICLPF